MATAGSASGRGTTSASTGGRVLRLAAASLYAIEFDAGRGQRVRQAHAVAVHELARLVEVEVAGAGGGAEQAPAEARALLVGPVHEPHRERRPVVVLRVDAAEHLE